MLSGHVRFCSMNTRYRRGGSIGEVHWPDAVDLAKLPCPTQCNLQRRNARLKLSSNLSTTLNIGRRLTQKFARCSIAASVPGRFNKIEKRAGSTEGRWLDWSPPTKRRLTPHHDPAVCAHDAIACTIRTAQLVSHRHQPGFFER